jgi:flagellar biosynthesis/type III secretory pathway M-ring protein FliF/YscJ
MQKSEEQTGPGASVGGVPGTASNVPAAAAAGSKIDATANGLAKSEEEIDAAYASACRPHPKSIGSPDRG